MLLKLIKSISISVLLSLCAQGVSANLLINPTRVDFHSNTRTVDVTLINTSQTTNTYRIEWAEKKATADGYEDLSPSAAASLPIASPMLRYSPRQVTLKPNERQTIKLAIRRPQGLANGEYRSHLLFKALPPPPADKNDGEVAPELKFNVVLSFAIPVVVVQGPMSYDVTLNDASISYNPNQKTGSVKVTMSRSGVNSTMGNINAYWTPNGGTEKLIAKTGDYNFWPEVSRTSVDLGWVGTEFAKTDGKLRIVYEGTKGFRGKTFFEKTITVTGGMIKTAN